MKQDLGHSAFAQAAPPTTPSTTAAPALSSPVNVAGISDDMGLPTTAAVTAAAVAAAAAAAVVAAAAAAAVNASAGAVAIGEDGQQLPDKSLMCEVCNKTYATKSSLRKHILLHKGDENPFVCTKCEKAFTCKNHLERHERIHNGDRLHRCPHCEKGFTDKSSLVKHIRIHTGERPFHCTLCDKTFYDKSHLARHRRMHTGEKPYCCDICQKTFSCRDSLHLHKFAHEHPDCKFLCSLCGLSFDARKALREHQVHEHKMDTANESTSDSQQVATNENENGQLACPKCVKVFCNTGALKKHFVKTHHSQGDAEMQGGAGHSLQRHHVQHYQQASQHSASAAHQVQHTHLAQHIPAQAPPPQAQMPPSLVPIVPPPEGIGMDVMEGFRAPMPSLADAHSMHHPISVHHQLHGIHQHTLQPHHLAHHHHHHHHHHNMEPHSIHSMLAPKPAEPDVQLSGESMIVQNEHGGEEADEEQAAGEEQSEQHEEEEKAPPRTSDQAANLMGVAAMEDISEHVEPLPILENAPAPPQVLS